MSNETGVAGNIFFVAGPSRSGTTLCSRVLGNHSQVLRLNELQYFGEFYDVDEGRSSCAEDTLMRSAAMLLARQEHDFWVAGPADDEKRLARQLVETLPDSQRNGADLYAAVLALLVAREHCEWACEQTPRNIFYAQALLDLYPHARMICMVRDPRAVLASQKNRWQLRRLGGNNVPYSELIRLWFNYHPVTMSSLWVRAMQVAMKLEHHPRVRLLRFEDLVSNPQQSVEALCDWLGLEFEPAMLEVPQWGSSNVVHSEEKRGVSTEMTSQWKQVLSDGEVRISERKTARFMQRFDYPQVTDGHMNFSAWALMLLRYPLHLAGAVLTNPRRVWTQLKAVLRTETA